MYWKHQPPEGENRLVWAGACALARQRHPSADYPQPRDLTDARIVVDEVLTLNVELVRGSPA